MTPKRRGGPIRSAAFHAGLWIATGALLGSVSTVAVAGKGLFGGRSAPPTEEAPLVEVTPAPFEIPRLFDGPLPLSTGPLADGLANGSAQGCYACHICGFYHFQNEKNCPLNKSLIH